MFEFVFMFMAGLIFFVFGIIGICKNKITIETAPIIIFPIVGAGIMFFTVMYTCEIPVLEIVQDNIDFILSISLLVFFFGVGIALVLGSIFDKKYKKEHCTYPLEAYCTDLGEDSTAPSLHDSDDLISSTYSPSWKYTYQGKEYTYKSNYGSSITPPDLETTYTIYIDPLNPKKAWVPEFSQHANFLFIGIIAIIISTVGGYAVLFL